MYAEYVYYTGTYYGTQIAEADWNRLASRASDFIDYYTLGKAAAWTEANPNNDAVKKCCCALAERCQLIEQVQRNALISAESGDGELQSESVGAYSRTYRDATETAASADEFAKATLSGVAQQYLLPTGLLYRGIGGCKECTHLTL